MAPIFLGQKLANLCTRSAIKILSVARFPDDILVFLDVEECPIMTPEMKHRFDKGKR